MKRSGREDFWSLSNSTRYLPRETREYLKHTLAIHSRRPSGGVGAHRLACWPTSY